MEMGLMEIVRSLNGSWIYDSYFSLYRPIHLGGIVRIPANSAMMSTFSVRCQWDVETAKERTGHPPSYAEAKKMKLLTLHTHGCPRASLRDCSSSLWIQTHEMIALL